MKCLGYLYGGVHKVWHGLTSPSQFLGWMLQSHICWGLEGNGSQMSSSAFLPEGTTKKLVISVSPSSEAGADESQPAPARLALDPVCFGEEDVVFPWVMSRGFISIHRQKQTEI